MWPAMAYLELMSNITGVTGHGLPCQQASEFTDPPSQDVFYCYSICLEFLNIFSCLNSNTYQLKMISINSFSWGLGYLTPRSFTDSDLSSLYFLFQAVSPHVIRSMLVLKAYAQSLLLLSPNCVMLWNIFLQSNQHIALLSMWCCDSHSSAEVILCSFQTKTNQRR